MLLDYLSFLPPQLRGCIIDCAPSLSQTFPGNWNKIRGFSLIFSILFIPFHPQPHRFRNIGIVSIGENQTRKSSESQRSKRSIHSLSSRRSKHRNHRFWYSFIYSFITHSPLQNLSMNEPFGNRNSRITLFPKKTKPSRLTSSRFQTSTACHLLVKVSKNPYGATSFSTRYGELTPSYSHST